MDGNTARTENLTDEMKEYALNFMAFMKEYLEGLVLPHQNTPDAKVKSMILSTACSTHAVSTSENFWKMKTING